MAFEIVLAPEAKRFVRSHSRPARLNCRLGMGMSPDLRPFSRRQGALLMQL
jgi:hypothetical protein